MKQHTINRQLVPRETFDEADRLIRANRHMIDIYLSALFWWNKRINLVSRNVPRETIMEHIRHSLLLTQLDIYKSSNFIVDTGTGGGLPGIPLAIISGDKKFLLNDIVSKKTAALKQMRRKIGLRNVEIRNGSVSELQINTTFLLISKHAFKISDLISLTEGLPWSAMIFFKGTDFENEIKYVDMPLNIDVYDLYHYSADAFYEGKSIVKVVRR